MLTDPMRKYLENPTEYKKQVQAVYNRRLRKYAVQALKDLTLLAEKLPEKQQAKIFSMENMNPFLAALFSPKSDDVEKRRKRVIGLWKALFHTEVITYRYAETLVGREAMKILTSKPDISLQAIYLATLFHES